MLELVRELQEHECRLYDLMKPPSEIDNSYIRDLLAEVSKHKGAFLVAEAPDGSLAGYATLLAVVSSEDEKDEKPHTYSYVSDLVVTAAKRGLGIGQALLEACEMKAREANQPSIRISVLADNMRARRVYHAAGFKDHLLTLTKTLT